MLSLAQLLGLFFHARVRACSVSVSVIVEYECVLSRVRACSVSVSVSVEYECVLSLTPVTLFALTCVRVRSVSLIVIGLSVSVKCTCVCVCAFNVNN